MPFSDTVLSVLAAGSGGSSGGGGGNGLVSFLPLILIVLVGYLLLIRPARNRQRKAMENRAAVTPGVEVTTTAGLIAKVVATDDDTVTLEVAPGVYSRYLKAAVARVNEPPPTEPVEPEPVEPASVEPPMSDDTAKPDSAER